MKVLVNAYACSPNMGSEPGMAWNWCVNLAKHCELFIITEGEFRDKIEGAMSSLPQSNNMHFYYNPVSQYVRRICWNQGDWRFYWYYRQWQKQTLKIAREICSNEKIEIIHHLNMIGYREPGLLWKISGPKYVWGPVCGLETMPIAYLKGAGVKTILFNRIKNFINSLQYRYQPNVRKAVKCADAIVAATYGCQQKLQDYYHRDVRLINETGCDGTISVERHFNESGSFHILWVAKFDFRKQLGLALHTIAELKDIDVVLHVAGVGDGSKYEKMAKDLQIEDKVVWDWVNHDGVISLMRKCDLLFFPSIMDATSAVINEAIQNKLPILCFNTCGFGSVVSSKIGRKIELSTPANSIKEFGNQIRDLYENRQLLNDMLKNFDEVIKDLSWESKANEMYNIYKSIV